jgi:hypothetical protein
VGNIIWTTFLIGKISKDHFVILGLRKKYICPLGQDHFPQQFGIDLKCLFLCYNLFFLFFYIYLVDFDVLILKLKN